ncbi:hypothetical protein IWW50_005356 [Coemansia erecta]|nr:hypothetical protein IWW50_005356 [Coemansia erecta]
MWYEGALEALTTMLHGAAVEIAQLHTELCSTGVQAAELLPADQPPANSGGTRVAQDALATATALAEMLRGFTRAARQGWTAARSQLAHMPSVPSPLSSGGSAQHHRRWVSEELEGESVAANRKPGASPDANRHGAGTLHARNRSDSRIQSASPHGVPLRKSALSLQRSSQPPGSPQPGADAAERAKQVRFQPSALGEPAVDQARLGELVQLLAKFEAAIALLGAVVQDRGAGGGGPAGRSDTYAQATKGLVAAFVQISRLSSTSGLVKHYDKAALAQFKTMTQGVKQLMAHPSSKA